MKYKRLIVTQRGGPEMLQAVEEELRPPVASEARVRVLTAVVSPMGRRVMAAYRFRPGALHAGVCRR